MKMPVWLSPALWGAACGAVALAIVGFNQLGWVTQKTAQAMAQDRAETQVVAALLPLCVARAQADPDHTLFVKIQSENSSYTRNEIIEKAGWATFGDKGSPNRDLARACSDKIHEMKAT